MWLAHHLRVLWVRTSYLNKFECRKLYKIEEKNCKCYYSYKNYYWFPRFKGISAQLWTLSSVEFSDIEITQIFYTQTYII